MLLGSFIFDDSHPLTSDENILAQNAVWAILAEKLNNIDLENNRHIEDEYDSEMSEPEFMTKK